MSTIEYAFAIAELKPKVEGKHLSRVRRVAERAYRIKIGACEILCELGVRMHETRRMEPPIDPDKFAQKAGKELDNARLLELRQVDDDRIVELRFERGSLFLEMFGKGNAILVQEGLTLVAASYESWAGRAIKAGAPYSPPPSSSSWSPIYNEKYVAVSMMKLPLGKEYVHEVLLRAGIDQQTPGTGLSALQKEAIGKEVSSMRASLSPRVYLKDGVPAALSLTSLSSMEGAEEKPFPSFGEAADEFYSSAVEADPRLEQLQRRLDKQAERLEELKAEERSHKAVGDLIYAHYQEVDEAIRLARAGRFDEIPGLDKKRIDKKERSMEIELQ